MYSLNYSEIILKWNYRQGGPWWRNVNFPILPSSKNVNRDSPNFSRSKCFRAGPTTSFVIIRQSLTATCPPLQYPSPLSIYVVINQLYLCFLFLSCTCMQFPNTKPFGNIYLKSVTHNYVKVHINLYIYVYYSYIIIIKFINHGIIDIKLLNNINFIWKKKKDYIFSFTIQILSSSD